MANNKSKKQSEKNKSSTDLWKKRLKNVNLNGYTILTGWIVMALVVVMGWLEFENVEILKMRLWGRSNTDDVVAVAENFYVHGMIDEARQLVGWRGVSAAEQEAGINSLNQKLHPEQEFYQELQEVEVGLKIQPTAKELLWRKMELLQLLGRLDEASIVLEQIEILDPNNEKLEPEEI